MPEYSRGYDIIHVKFLFILQCTYIYFTIVNFTQNFNGQARKSRNSKNIIVTKPYTYDTFDNITSA